MTTVASLRVALEADATKFRTAMAGAISATKQFAIAGAASAAAGAAFIKSGLDSADEISKLSQRTGVSAEALSVLRHAASLADTDIKTVGRSIGFMGRALVEAQNGAKRQAEAFQALGINIKTFAQLRPEQQFAAISDALNRVGTEAEFASLGSIVFGGSFQKIAALVRGGTKALNEASQAAHENGLILSQESVDAAARANDAIDTIAASFGAFRDQLAVGFAPEIANIFEFINERLRAWIPTIKAVFGALSQLLGGLAFAQQRLFNGDFRGAFNVLKGLGGDISQEFFDRTNRNASSESPVDFAADAKVTAEATTESTKVLRQILEVTRTNGPLAAL